MENISDDECVAIQYVFANEEKKTFFECSAEEREEIINAKIEERCEIYTKKRGVWFKALVSEIAIDAIYRARKPAPAPNEIDWSQFPSWVKACATTSDKQSFIFEDVPNFIGNNGYHYTGRLINITDFPGFKRGTVDWKNSLLIKPEGK